MRLTRVRITDALHDAQRLLFEQFRQAIQGWMETDFIVDFFDLILGNLDRWPVLNVKRIGKWYDRVQAVVAAGELDHEEPRRRTALARLHR